MHHQFVIQEKKRGKPMLHDCRTLQVLSKDVEERWGPFSEPLRVVAIWKFISYLVQAVEERLIVLIHCETRYLLVW